MGKSSALTRKELKNIKLAALIFIIAVSAFWLALPQKQIEQKHAETVAEADTNTEQRLEKILSGIKGAGNVRVMIVYKDSGKENIAMNTEYSEDSDGSIKTQNTAVLGGNKEVIVVQKSIPEVQGVIVTASGAADAEVRDNIKKAVAAALPVMSHRIEVLIGE